MISAIPGPGPPAARSENSPMGRTRGNRTTGVEMSVTLPRVDELGPLVSSHQVDSRPRWIVGGVAAVIGAGATALMAVFSLHPALTAGSGKIAALLGIGIAAGYGVAAVQLTTALRAGREERFDVHELGIAHLTDARHRKWRWDQVRWVRGGHTQGARNRLRRFGWDHTCRADFTDGASIQFNGLTTDAESITAALYARCPSAIALDDEIHRWHIWRWFLAAGFGWALVSGFLWLNEDHTTVVDHGGWSEEVDTLDDSTLVVVATGVTFCFIGFITSMTYLFLGFRAQLRRRDQPTTTGSQTWASGLTDQPLPSPAEYATILVGDVLQVPGMDAFADELDRAALARLTRSIDGIEDEEVVGTIHRPNGDLLWEPHPAFAEVGVRRIILAREELDLVIHPGEGTPIFAVLMDDCESELDFRLKDLPALAEGSPSPQ